MNIDELNREIAEFNKSTHGSTDYYKDELFLKGEREGEFAPLSFISKNLSQDITRETLAKLGHVFDSFTFYSLSTFKTWFEKQFSRKLLSKISKNIIIAHIPNNKVIIDAVTSINDSYELLRKEHILMNGKNLPVQLGEWYGKCIFGLNQIKSTSQRGFDFFLCNDRVEIKVHWSDQSSPKGVKLKKSLIGLSKYTIIIYLARNFMIREICFLDSEFVQRKFSGKGHTMFLKDPDISSYFFSQSDKHVDKVVNSTALLKFANPNFAMKIAEKF